MGTRSKAQWYVKANNTPPSGCKGLERVEPNLLLLTATLLLLSNFLPSFTQTVCLRLYFRIQILYAFLMSLKLLARFIFIHLLTLVLTRT